MSLHDAYARLTPFEIAFPDAEAIEALLAQIDEEAAGRGVDPTLQGVFLTLGSVDDFVRGLQPPGASESAMSQYGALVFHAAHFVRAGRPVFLLTVDATRALVNRAPDARPAPPAEAGYLQLPQHLLWMEGSEDSAPESIDGIFWVASPLGALHTLPVTGVLPDSPGFRALPLNEAPLSHAEAWLHEDMREGGRDFSSSLPGGELDELYAVQTAGEVLKLLARFFSHVASGPEATRPGEGASAMEEHAPKPSALSYTRVGLVG